jgi:hypothetical protein
MFIQLYMLYIHSVVAYKIIIISPSVRTQRRTSHQHKIDASIFVKRVLQNKPRRDQDNTVQKVNKATTTHPHIHKPHAYTMDTHLLLEHNN